MSEILYDQVKAAQYMTRLLQAKYFPIEKGHSFFEYIRDMGGNLKHLLRNVIEDVKSQRDVPEKQEALKQLFHIQGRSWHSDVLCRELFEVANEAPYVKSFIRIHALKLCEEISKYQTSDAKNYELIRKKFENIFGLSNDALDFLEFACIYEVNDYID